MQRCQTNEVKRGPPNVRETRHRDAGNREWKLGRRRRQAGCFACLFGQLTTPSSISCSSAISRELKIMVNIWDYQAARGIPSVPTPESGLQCQSRSSPASDPSERPTGNPSQTPTISSRRGPGRLLPFLVAAEWDAFAKTVDLAQAAAGQPGSREVCYHAASVDIVNQV